MADPWADPNLQRPCTDRGAPDWQRAYAVAQKHMDALRMELARADNDGGFWKYVAQPEQVACQWAWTIDGGAHGGSLIRALASRGVFTPGPGGGSGAAVPQTAGPGGGQTTSGQVPVVASDPGGQMTAWASKNPLIAAAAVGVVVLLLVRR